MGYTIIKGDLFEINFDLFFKVGVWWAITQMQMIKWRQKNKKRNDYHPKYRDNGTQQYIIKKQMNSSNMSSGQGIEQEIEQMNNESGGFMDEEFNIDMGQSNNSFKINNSQAVFTNHNIVITKKGARQNSNEILEINTQCLHEIKCIGRGSSGEVWLANYKISEHVEPIQVAIKEISIGKKQLRQQFIKDLKVFLSSDSPYLVKFYGCFYKQNFLHEVIEYMDMGSLRDLINFNRKSNNQMLMESVLAAFSYCILQGLNYIHKQKHQIHRDIKPENILINTKGQIKITDFGICKQLDNTQGNSTSFIGTFNYMSPERMEGDKYNLNCDIWSFGLVLYELATCRNIPYQYQKDNIYSLISNIRKIPPPTFQKQDNRSPQFCNFLNRCLEKDPGKRASVRQLLEHPWLINNSKTNILPRYIKAIYNEMKKIQKSS